MDITASFNESTGLATWTFTSIDPVTFNLPTDPFAGFLPPNQVSPEGEGFVSYTVQPLQDLATGTQIQAQGTVVFDTNDPIDTPLIFNTIDSGPPTSSVNPLPKVSEPNIFVSWSGQDDKNGSGIAFYDVYVSIDGGAFAPWLLHTTATSAIYAAKPHHLYGFYSVATDNVGNRELATDDFQAITLVLPTAPHFGVQYSKQSTTAGDPFSITITALDDNGDPITDYAGTIRFLSWDGRALLPDDYTFTPDDGGSHTFDGVVLYQAGDQWTRVSDVDTHVTGSGTITVTPAAADHFRVTAPIQATSGTPFDLTVIALDPYGNIDFNYAGTVTFSSTDPDPGVILPHNFVFTPNDAGMATFPSGATLITPGDETISVVDIDSGIAGSVLITVLPATGPRF